ncbi:MAG TPA: hypothetical protein VFN37_08150, partial [Candidatus Baltobacteraceae bacterium]|nr:hypothetical protein [Candidatus Baltobacteraceae bacterium]
MAAARGGKLSSARRTMAVQTSVVQTSTVGQTGINRWWTYEEGGIPGIGKYMVNVANGNLLVQTGDVDVHERGIDLAFRRTYNGQPGVQRDWNASGT